MQQGEPMEESMLANETLKASLWRLNPGEELDDIVSSIMNTVQL